jgi:restriction endonuclease S subunit
LRISVSDIAMIITGHPFRGKIPEKSGSGICVVQMKNISADNNIIWDNLIETELTGKKQPDWLMLGDVLFAARGSRNYAALIDQSRERVVSSPHFYIIRLENQALLPEFLAWQLNQKRGVAIFAKACFGHPSPSKRQKLNATAYAFGAPDVLRTCHFATPS